ncbi:LysE family translocator [Anianabacter salinae]|uniref:LysE family translocator n=1 Tax=Anianabacter salinae TaxID=2851023 RepID=UPI00225E1764|nr:LysE family translocator [Anianabacter salinae]MBV0913224.1 LysE family translocator [Anianabacter salinae]
MTFDILLALAAFCLVTLFSPGPNNLMLMASGANYGVRRSLPHLSGVAVGFPLMILPVGLGVMQLFEAFPPLHLALKIASVAYLLYLAWKIAHATTPKEAEAGSHPLSFFQAAAFQWVNPKAWSMALGAITLYAPGRDIGSILWICAAFLLIGVGSALTWTTLGTAVRRLLADPRRLQVFNWTMAALLVASMAFVLIA